MESKICNTCGLEKSIDSFSRHNPIKAGKQYHYIKNQCKECEAFYKREDRRKNPDKYKNFYKQRRSNPEYVQDCRDRDKKYREKNKEQLTNKRYLREYGISLDEAREIYSRGCEVCSSKEDLHIDHCHQTGQVRGCLCTKCNTALGLLKDNKQIMSNLIDYIERAERKLFEGATTNKLKGYTREDDSL
jgi:hypothetical protein